MSLWNLDFWKSGEYQVIRERLDDLRKKGTMICPQRKEITRALREVSYEDCKVAILGQDPYPNPDHATGIAFCLPPDVRRDRWPPTFLNIVKEYTQDLHHLEPKTGDLTPWTKQGVLLWNVIPTCTAFQSLSHDWCEWEELNKELINKLEQKDEMVFVFLGSIARRYEGLVSRHPCISCSHPSPRANLNARVPFLGSRLFSTINSYMKQPINWRLP